MTFRYLTRKIKAVLTYFKKQKYFYFNGKISIIIMIDRFVFKSVCRLLNAIFWYFSSIRLYLTLLFIISIQGKLRGLKLSVCMHVCNFWKKNVSLMSIPCTAKYSLCYLTYLCTVMICISENKSLNFYSL